MLMVLNLARVMMVDTNYRDNGAASAYQAYGLDKLAGIPIPKGKVGILASIKHLLTPGKDFGRRAGEFVVGEPKKFWGELASGKALDKGSLIRQSFHSPGILNKALFYGIPAYGVGSVLGDNEGDKVKRIGGELGGAALSMAAFKPLGLAGAIAGGMGGAAIGEGIGGVAQNVVG
jgi:hypothetical protein